MRNPQEGFANVILISVIVAIVGAVVLYFYRLPPIKYWTQNPTNFEECKEATRGVIIKTLPAQCEFRGQNFVDQLIQQPAHVPNPTPTPTPINNNENLSPSYNSSFYNFTYLGNWPPTYPNIPKSAEANSYLPIWRKAFQEKNGISDEYFNSHIYVVTSSIYEGKDENGKIFKRLSVTYFFLIDWARVHMTDDSFLVSFEGIDNKITAEELIRDMSLPIYATKYKFEISINKIKPISSIASKSEIAQAVKNLSPLLKFDVNKDFDVRDGLIYLRLRGVVNDSKNECLSGKILLEDPSVAEKSNPLTTPCRIY